MSAEPLALYRGLLRAARTFPDYQLQQYIARRTKEDFRKFRQLKDVEKKNALEYGQQQLELVKRQSVIRKMYEAPKSVVEIRKQTARKTQ